MQNFVYAPCICFHNKLNNISIWKIKKRFGWHTITEHSTRKLLTLVTRLYMHGMQYATIYYLHASFSLYIGLSAHFKSSTRRLSSSNSHFAASTLVYSTASWMIRATDYTFSRPISRFWFFLVAIMHSNRTFKIIWSEQPPVILLLCKISSLAREVFSRVSSRFLLI